MIPALLSGRLGLLGTVLILRACSTGKLGEVSAIITGEPLSILAGIGVRVMLIGLQIFATKRANRAMSAGASRSAILLEVAGAALWGIGVVVLYIGTRVSAYGVLAVILVGSGMDPS